MVVSRLFSVVKAQNSGRGLYRRPYSRRIRVMVASRASESSLHADSLPEYLREILARVRPEQFEVWFRSLNLERSGDSEVEFSVTSSFVRNWLLKNYLSPIQEATRAVRGTECKVLISLREEDQWDNLSLVSLPAPVSQPQAPGFATVESPDRVFPSKSAPAMALPQGPFAASRLNPDNTFDKFVVGPCNRLAHAACLAASDNPGCSYNPLFVHGNVGLGKTHLLQAICHAILRKDPAARVLYLSCEDFTNAFIQAIQAGRLEEFRSFCRSVDVLLVDDVQFLANKEKTQDEFFHTFNALHDAKSQIVMSSDRDPIEIPTIEERLVSRFKWGLVAAIEQPCFETRVAVVRRKARGRGVDIPEDVAHFIAERITTNIREIEGAVISVVGVSSITGRPITQALAEEALRGVGSNRQAQVTPEDVMGLITSEFSISARDLTGKSRTQAISLPRQIAMFLVRSQTKLSLEDIGRYFGNRDHTTVLYAVQKIQERSQKDRIFKEMLDGLSSRLMARLRR
ncbi:MAG: chromosomal replication initiator protein DnaA [Planctomycetota bacterium]